eukprot:423226_1
MTLFWFASNTSINNYSLFNIILIHMLYIFLNVNGQTNDTTTPPTTPIPDTSTTIFITTQYRFDIDIEILVTYQFNQTTVTNINSMLIKHNIMDLFGDMILNEKYVIDSSVSNTNELIIDVDINTNNEDDVDMIIEYVTSDIFKQNTKDILQLSNDNIIILDIIVIVDYIDNEDNKLDWLDPLNYTAGQYLVTIGSLVILSCIIIVCGVYCCLCNNPQRGRYSKASRHKSWSAEVDGPPVHSLNNRSTVQLGTAVQYVD